MAFGVRGCLIQATLGFILGTSAGVAVAQAQASLQYSLPAQPLADALRAVATQASLNVVFDPPVVADRMAPALQAELTTKEVLTRLLEGTGLAFEFVSERTVAIHLAPASSGIQGGAQGRDANGLLLAQSENSSADDGTRNSATSKEVSQDSIGIQEIIVTAQKREQSAKDVPISLSVVGADRIEHEGIKSILDLSFSVPGLSVFQQGPGKMDINIRGVGGGRGSSSVNGVYLDDMSLTGAQDGFTSTYIDIRPYDLQRIEVLKGPQGTLFGEGAVGGVIRYVTNDPVLDRFGGSADVTYFDTKGGAGSTQVTGAFNAPIVEDKLAVRIAGTSESNGGWIENIATGKSNFNDNHTNELRAKVLFSPIAALKIKGLFQIHREHAGGPDQIVAEQPPYEPVYRQAVFPASATDIRNDFELYNLTATYDFGFATLLSSTSYFNLRVTQNLTQIFGPLDVPYDGVDILIPEYHDLANMRSQELRLTSNGEGPAKWTVGGYYKNAEISRFYPPGYAFSLNGTLLLAGVDSDLRLTDSSEAYAAFADASYTIAEKVELGAGIRAFRDKRREVALGQTPGDVRGTFDKTTYRAFVRYHVADGVNVYASVANGFRSGGFNAASQIAIGAPPTYGPENALFYEVGLKSTALGGKFSLDVALYDGKFKDQLYDVITNTFVNGQFLQYTANAGTSTLKGVDWDLSVAPLRGLLLSFSGNWNESKLVAANNVPSVVVGDPQAITPKYLYTLSGSYRSRLGDELSGFFRLSYNKRGPMHLRVADLLQQSPEVAFMQASAGLEYGRYEFTVFGRNLLNETDPITVPYGQVHVPRPRSIGLTVGTQF